MSPGSEKKHGRRIWKRVQFWGVVLDVFSWFFSMLFLGSFWCPFWKRFSINFRTVSLPKPHKKGGSKRNRSKSRFGEPERCLFECLFSTFLGSFLRELEIAQIHIFTMDFNGFGIYFRFFSRCTSGAHFGTNLGVVLLWFLFHFGVAERVFTIKSTRIKK